MSSKKGKPPKPDALTADNGVKVNYTDPEMEEIQAAVSAWNEYKNATWLRKISLMVARGQLVPAAAPEKRKSGR